MKWILLCSSSILKLTLLFWLCSAGDTAGHIWDTRGHAAAVVAFVGVVALGLGVFMKSKRQNSFTFTDEECQHQQA